MVPLKRGIWFRWNADRWRSALMFGTFTFFEIHFQPLVFGFVLLNFTFDVYTVDPKSPPITYKDGKAFGLVHE